jgi:hypothetical protein
MKKLQPDAAQGRLACPCGEAFHLMVEMDEKQKPFPFGQGGETSGNGAIEIMSQSRHGHVTD